MLNTANLSLEQAPPISIPFRFFLTAPLFAVAAGLMLLIQGPDLLVSRWSSWTLALTHLLTLGFLTMVMCGAMLQMLPVLAGSPVPQVMWSGRAVHLLLTVGTLLLVAGFIVDSGVWLVAAMFSLGAGIAIFAGAVGIALWRVQLSNFTVSGMRYALVSLVVTVVLGILLVAVMAGVFPMRIPISMTDIHFSWGIFGWMGLLVIAVSFQVVPLFHITPEYPDWMRRWLIRLLFLGLSSWTLLDLWLVSAGPPGGLIGYWLAMFLMAFPLYAATTLSLLQRRKRSVPDITLMFWRVAMIAIQLCMLVWILVQLIPDWQASTRYPVLLGVGLSLGCAMAVVNGMLYKIVPFLSWFHLQNRQLMLQAFSVNVPNMKELISDRMARRQFWLFLAALLLMLVAVFYPQWLVRPAAALFALSNLLLALNLFQATRRYRNTDQALRSYSVAR